MDDTEYLVEVITNHKEFEQPLYIRKFKVCETFDKACFMIAHYLKMGDNVAVTKSSETKLPFLKFYTIDKQFQIHFNPKIRMLLDIEEWNVKCYKEIPNSSEDIKQIIINLSIQ